MISTRKIGAKGEEVCCQFLESIGFTVKERNFMAKHKEIDIIAENDRYIVFAEVKLRTISESSSRFGRPALAVTKAKMKNIIFAAKAYLRANPSDKSPRFDVIEVYAEPVEDRIKYRLKHIPSAFRLDDAR